VRRSAAALVLLLATGAACSSSSKHAATTATAAQRASITYQFIPFDQLDPQHVSDGEAVAGQNLLEGMVTPNAAGTDVVPATADLWTVSRDGTVYTFHIRRDAAWSDGTPVTAQDFEWTYKRLLTPSTRTSEGLNGANSYRPDVGIKNALAYQQGQITDWSKVGVKALDPAHLQITLVTSHTSFLMDMADVSMVALPRANIEAHPYSWQTAANWVGNGPFVVKSWTPNTTMVLARNPRYWDRAHVQLEQVTVVSTTPHDPDVVARYKDGRLDIARLDDPHPFANDQAVAPALTQDDEYSVQALTLVPSLSPVLRDVRVREAIALAIDRDDIAKAGLVTPATSLMPSKLPGSDATVGFTEDIPRARRLLAEAGYPGGRGFPTFSVMTYKDDPNVRALVASLHRNLGINAVQDAEDPGVWDAKRHQVQPKTFAGYFANGFGAILTWRSWVSDTYPPAQTELLSLAPADYTRVQVLQSEGTTRAIAEANAFLAAHASGESRQFAALAQQADTTPDANQATALYKQAAALRQQTFEFIPYGYRAQTYLVRPGISGVHFWSGYFTISFKDVRVGS
jgi:ABC-type oligopeptide transport system substrate-binding subunit